MFGMFLSVLSLSWVLIGAFRGVSEGFSPLEKKGLWYSLPSIFFLGLGFILTHFHI